MGVGYMKMDGIAVARQANKDMARVMQAAAQTYGVDISSLARVIPHPGSKRILRSVAGRSPLRRNVES
jgi:3-oxoacyl-[acyl-carrier-protein] synthase III